MNKQIRRLALALMAIYVILFVQLNVLQVAKARTLNRDPANTRGVIRDFSKARGTIYSADETPVVIAESVPSNDRYIYQRKYPTGDLFGHPVGYFSLKYGTTEVELAQNDVLAGQTAQQQLSGLGDLFSNKTNTGDVYLTLRADLQQVAKTALGTRIGSVVLLDPRSGAIRAMWSNPSMDPNPVASHDFAIADTARKALIADPEKPLLANAYQERYMPGSTFKVLTATAGLENKALSVDTLFSAETEWVPPNTQVPIRNYAGEVCGGTMQRVFEISCNIPFAQTAAALGPDKMVEAIDKFGFNEKAPLDLPDVAASYFGQPKDFSKDIPRLAQSGFGQNAVQGTPLELALVASAVANKGQIMAPFVVEETRDSTGGVLSRTKPKVWKTPMGPETAATLGTFMTGVVTNGTARCCMKLANGIQAAAKTGTAQLRGPTEPGGQSSHAWIIGFAPAENPVVAFAVFVKASPEVTAGVGATIAGPVARTVVDAALTVLS
jgi:penicillin-binding protein A